MGFLRKVLGRSAESDRAAPGPKLEVDLFLGDEAARDLANAIETDDGAGFRAYLAGEPDLERRDFVLETATRAGKVHGPWLDRWVADEPDSALAHLVHGRDLVYWAWQARGTRMAEHVKVEQFEQFFPRLELAWRELERATELDPGEGTAYASMIDCAKGLELDLETRIQLYEAAQAHRPWQLLAHSSLIQAIAPKWGAPEGLMVDFAGRVMAEAPEGSGVHVVVPEAHVEGALASGLGYWKDPAVRTAILAATERSVESPAFAPTPWAPKIRNTFGYCLWRLGERDRARQQFDLAGPVVAGPFMFYRSPEGKATRARREVGAAIQR